MFLSGSYSWSICTFHRTFLADPLVKWFTIPPPTPEIPPTAIEDALDCRLKEWCNRSVMVGNVFTSLWILINWRNTSDVESCCKSSNNSREISHLHQQSISWLWWQTQVALFAFLDHVSRHEKWLFIDATPIFLFFLWFVFHADL